MGVSEASGDVWDVRGVLGASRDSRKAGARRSIGSIRGYWGLLGGVGGHFRGGWWCRGVRGVLGSSRVLGIQ